MKQRSEEASKAVRALEFQHRPSLEDLVVLGKQLRSCVAAAPPRSPVVTISRAAEPRCKDCLNEPEERVALAIRGREFVAERGRCFERLSANESEAARRAGERLVPSVLDGDQLYRPLASGSPAITWSLSFEGEGAQLCRKVFSLHNRGVRTLSVEWRAATRDSELPLAQSLTSSFVFDKRRACILPGQSLHVPVCFRANDGALAVETWSLLVEPRVYPGALLLRLFGTSVGSHRGTRQRRALLDAQTRLAHRLRNSLVRGLLEELLLAATSEPLAQPVPYGRFFLEAEVFRARNPGHRYCASLVEEARLLWRAVSDDPWSLSMGELRARLLRMNRPLERRAGLERLRRVSDAMLGLSEPREGPSGGGQRAVYRLLCGLFNRFEEEGELALASCGSGDSSLRQEDDMWAGELEEDADAGQARALPALCGETLRVRIRSLLGETVDRACAALDAERCCS